VKDQLAIGEGCNVYIKPLKYYNMHCFSDAFGDIILYFLVFLKTLVRELLLVY